jgi:hypothetical protein
MSKWFVQPKMPSSLRIEKEEKEIDCGKAVITRYFDEENKLVRQDCEIIVDPLKLPKLGAKVQWP